MRPGSVFQDPHPIVDASVALESKSILPAKWILFGYLASQHQRSICHLSTVFKTKNKGEFAKSLVSCLSQQKHERAQRFIIFHDQQQSKKLLQIFTSRHRSRLVPRYLSNPLRRSVRPLQWMLPAKLRVLAPHSAPSQRTSHWIQLIQSPFASQLQTWMQFSTESHLSTNDKEHKGLVGQFGSIWIWLNLGPVSAASSFRSPKKHD